MIKKITHFILFAFLMSLPLQAQAFKFEDAAVPAEWIAVSGGSLSITTEHKKEGNASLRWETDGDAVLVVSSQNFTASTGNSAYMQIYSSAVTNDTLTVEFLNNANVRRTANYLLNYKGWRDFNRAYNEYVSNVSFAVTSVRFTLKPSSAGTRIIGFDDVQLNRSTMPGRFVGPQWLLDHQYFGAAVNKDQLLMYANPVDIAAETPTAEEQAALVALRNQFARTPATANVTILNQAKTFANGLNLTTNSDGTISGKPIDLSPGTLTNATVTDYVTKLEALAAQGMKNDAATLNLFRDFLEHMLNQGFAEGLNFSIRSNDYTASRNIPAKLLNLWPAAKPAQRAELIKLVRWISYYDMMYEPEESYLSKLNSDIVYLYLPHMFGASLFIPNNAEAVRDLKAFKRFLERNTEYVPGGNDILKPDGTGFHHKTQYNNYMYAYQTWSEHISALKGTPFRIDLDAYERFKKAVVAKYTMATLDNNNNRHYANTLSGRNPFGSGVQLAFNRNLFEKLIEAGGDILGTPIDEDLAGAYNYFFNSTKYNVPAKSYEGFHQFNYGDLGIYRKDNWVATMHAPTTKTWGAEIYSGANRFGRYQSHGALEITYNGSVAASGYPGNGTGGGWDWNVVPGTTTVHYTSWQEMMPNKNTTDRFDQFTKTKNFSGALSWGDCGVFATDFDQIDNWGNQRFIPTNLVFKKSMYAFDDIIISLGSNISSSGSYATSMITATNLFQNLTSSLSGTLLHNGVEVTLPNNLTLPSGQDNWILSPQGTGYFLPQTNDEVKLIHTTQKTPHESGSDYSNPTTSANAAKAYINHGVKPSNKSYSFVVIPATNAAEMQTKADLMAGNGGEVYEILSQDENLHALEYKPRKITAYSFFGPKSNITFGIVKAADVEHLLMHKADEETQRQYFAVSNPNLRPVNDALYGWRSSATQLTLTIAGEWASLHNAEGVVVQSPGNGETKVSITLKDGEPVYFGLKTLTDTNVEEKQVKEWVKMSQTDENLNFYLSSAEEISISLYTVDGKTVSQKSAHAANGLVSIPVSNLSGGLYICRIQSESGKNASFKWLKKN